MHTAKKKSLKETTVKAYCYLVRHISTAHCYSAHTATAYTLRYIYITLLPATALLHHCMLQHCYILYATVQHDVNGERNHCESTLLAKLRKWAIAAKTAHCYRALQLRHVYSLRYITARYSTAQCESIAHTYCTANVEHAPLLQHTAKEHHCYYELILPLHLVSTWTIWSLYWNQSRLHWLDPSSSSYTVLFSTIIFPRSFSITSDIDPASWQSSLLLVSAHLCLARSKNHYC